MYIFFVIWRQNSNSHFLSNLSSEKSHFSKLRTKRAKLIFNLKVHFNFHAKNVQTFFFGAKIKTKKLLFGLMNSVFFSFENNYCSEQ